MKNCTPLWREAHFEVKMYKTPQRRTTFGSCDVEKVHAIAAFFPVNFRVRRLLPNVRLHFGSACSHQMCVRVPGAIWAAAFSL
jgi:hypothetical protein